MDALALLCTLHADGPTTLRRLRDAGCTSLEELARVRADHLADLLGVSPAQGRRFLREAAGLAERLGERGLDGEEEPAGPAAGRPTIAPAPAAPAPAEGRDLDRTDRRVLERVIERWREEEERERDGADPYEREGAGQRAVVASLAGEPAAAQPVVTQPVAAQPVGALPGGRAAREGGAIGREPARASAATATTNTSGAPATTDTATTNTGAAAARAAAPAAPAASTARTATADAPPAPGSAARRAPEATPTATPAVTPSGPRIAPGAVDGLDAALCDRLAALGCRDLADLAARPALDLARDLGRPFTLVRRIQFLAARAAATTRRDDAPVERLSPSFDAVPCEVEGDDEGPAGPFA